MKALILGAAVEPLEGPWIVIDPARSWRVEVLTIPAVSLLRDSVTLEVMLSNGSSVTLPVSDKTEISGSRVRAMISEKVEGVRAVSLLLREII